MTTSILLALLSTLIFPITLASPSTQCYAHFIPHPLHPHLTHPFFVDSLVILGTLFDPMDFITTFVSRAIESSKNKLDAISLIESLQLQLLLVRFCITPTTIVHFFCTINPFILKLLSDVHHDYIIKFLQKATEHNLWQVSISFDFGGLGLTNTTYMSTILAHFNVVPVNWPYSTVLSSIITFFLLLTFSSPTSNHS